MKKLTIFTIVLFVVLFSACSSNAEGASNNVSGTVDAGLRRLPVGAGTGNLDFTVYRGDYIVFDFADSGTYDFVIEELEINEELPKPQSEKPYVKMKKSGEYKFTLGEREGVIRVIELEEPNYTELTAQEASELMANTDPLILDVRTEGEFVSGHIEGSKLLPVQVIAGNLDQLEQYKDRDIFLYCASGNRSTTASRILLDAGFTNIYNLRYGIGDWVRKGNPVIK